jgi:hypothetical protein
MALNASLASRRVVVDGILHTASLGLSRDHATSLIGTRRHHLFDATMNAKIDLNIPRDIKNERVVSDLVQEIRAASQIKDNTKLLCIVLGICRIVNELPHMRDETKGLRITVDAVSDGSALEAKEYNGADYSCKIE